MRNYLLVILGLLLVATAHGQSVFKCKQKDGTTAYQDHPCPGAPNANPAMIIKPSDEASDDLSQSQQLTPQQRARLAEATARLRQSLERLRTDLQRIQAKQAQAAGTTQQGGATNTH